LVDLKNIKTQRGENLHDMSSNQLVLLVFLRQLGCIFCKQALNDLSGYQELIRANSMKLVFVHMAKAEIAEELFNEFEFKDISHISDINCDLYKHFGLAKGSFTQLFGLQTWIKGYEAKKEGIDWSSKVLGDSLQLPGIFILKDGKILKNYIHKTASDRPDYDKLINCCVV
jgi:hypothetical protein